MLKRFCGLGKAGEGPRSLIFWYGSLDYHWKFTQNTAADTWWHEVLNEHLIQNSSCVDLQQYVIKTESLGVNFCITGVKSKLPLISLRPWLPLLIAIVEILRIVWFTWGGACCNCDNHSCDPPAQGTVSLEQGSGKLMIVIQAVGRQLCNTKPINRTIWEQNAKYILLKICFQSSASI